MLKRYALYLLRWQLSTPILAPIVAYFNHSPSRFGTPESWLGSAVANLVGGLIFFWVDRWIFSKSRSERKRECLNARYAACMLMSHRD